MPSEKKGFMGLTLSMTPGRWIMVGFGGLALVVAGVAIWMETSSSSVDNGAAVNVQSASGVHNAPGKSSPAYAKEVQEYNQQHAKQALDSGQSFVGIPVTSVTAANLSAPPVQTQPQPVVSTQPEPVNPSNATAQPQPISMTSNSAIEQEVDEVAKELKHYRQVNPGVYVPVYRPVQPALAYPVSDKASLPDKASATSHADRPAIVPGTILYGVFENAMKSTVPGPVVGELVQGKYNGYRVIGDFTKPSNSNHLVIRFHSLVSPDGKVIPIDGYAVSPKTTLPAMATNVNYHVLSRVGSFLGAAFLAGVEGYGQALSQEGSTTVNSAFGGVTQTYPTLTPGQTLAIAGASAAQELQPLQEALTNNIMEPNTVSVAASTPFALLVVSSGKASTTAAVGTGSSPQKTMVASGSGVPIYGNVGELPPGQPQPIAVQQQPYTQQPIVRNPAITHQYIAP